MKFNLALTFLLDFSIEESSVRGSCIKDATYEKMKNIRLEFLDEDNKPLEVFIMTAKVDRDRDEIKSVDLPQL